MNRESNLADSDLQDIGKLAELRRLDLWGCLHVTDEGLQRLAELKQLRELSLGGTKVTN